MTRKDVITLAEMLRIHNRTANGRTEFTPDHLSVLADFCAAQFCDRRGGQCSTRSTCRVGQYLRKATGAAGD